MKTANLKLVKRNVASALLATSAILLITSSTEAMSTPWTINADIHEAVGPKPGCLSGFGGTITGSGTSSLGDVSVAGGDCITPTSPTSFEFDHGKIKFTFLSGEWSGEQIFANYHGLFMQTDSTSDSPSIFEFVDAVLKIKGGTGSFEDAEGRAKLSGMEDIFTGLGSLSATVKRFDFDNDRDDEDGDKDRKKKDNGGKENDSDDKKKNSGGKEEDDDRAKKSNSDRRIAGGAGSQALIGEPSNTTMITGLDSGFFPHRQSAGQPLGEFFHLDNSLSQLLAINAVPEVGSLSLLGIGLAGLVVARRRKSVKKATDPAGIGTNPTSG